MKKIFNGYIIACLASFLFFLILFVLLMTTNKEVVYGKEIGLYAFNQCFKPTTYIDAWDGISDAVLYISLGFAAGLGCYGFYQLVERKSLFKVDLDILLTAGAIIIMIIIWLIFDHLLIVNYRPIVIDGTLQSSFPSTHIMITTFIYLISWNIIIRRNPGRKLYYILGLIGMCILILICFLGRVLSGMHWMTDALGGLSLGLGLYFLPLGIEKIIKSRAKA